MNVEIKFMFGRLRTLCPNCGEVDTQKACRDESKLPQGECRTCAAVYRPHERARLNQYGYYELETTHQPPRFGV